MHIHYFGLSSFKIITKDATVITDPFGKDSGLTPPRGAADILMLSQKNNPLYSAVSGISGEPFLMDDPGEYDVKGVTVTGIPLTQEDGSIISVFLIESEDIKILNLSHIKNFSIKEDDLDNLGDIDIVIIPVGGESVLDPGAAAKIVNQISPRITIPSHYSSSGLKVKAKPVENFIKEMGGKAESMDKLLIKKKDLVGEDIKVITLEALR